MLTWWHYLTLLAVAFAVTVFCVPAVRRFAVRHGAVDQPGKRRVNRRPIPRLGGVAMLIGMLVAFLMEFLLEIFGVWDGLFIIGIGEANTRLIGVVCGLVLVVAVGALDDFFALAPAVKFGGQLVAAFVIACTGTLLDVFKLPFTDITIELGAWAVPITVIYLVCFANIINLIDGLDGLAGGVSGISAACLFFLTMTLGRGDAAVLALIMVGICIGFLLYNFNPASVFMGDSGSLLLGMGLGTISLLGASRFASVTALAVPIVIAGVPLIDTASAIIRRLRGHQSITTADAGHVHHRLLNRGFSQRKSVLLIYLWTAFLCVCACIIWSYAGLVKYLILVLAMVVSGFLVHKLGMLGPVLEHHYSTEHREVPIGGTPEQLQPSSGRHEDEQN